MYVQCCRNSCEIGPTICTIMRAIGVFLLVCFGFVCAVSNDDPVVETVYGPVRGVNLEADGARAFYGVPFAAPPVGDLRWESPREPESWAPEEWLATENPPGCPQICEGVNPPIDCPAKTSEDCLYINIFTPFEASPSSKLPVLLYIHGGGNYVNSAASPIFDGRFLAAMTSSVVAVPNYRLGALGFLLTVNGTKQNQGDPYDYHGYGIQDQRQAMEFVQSNIGSFGGDPDKVTLVGQSAGALSVAIHLTSEESDTLFHQVVMQSAPFTTPMPTEAQAEKLAKLVAEYLECMDGDIECLRSKPADEVVVAQTYAAGETIKWLDDILISFQPWGPVRQNGELDLLEKFATGKFQIKPMILGGVSEEGRWSVYDFLPTEVPKLVSLPFYLLLFGFKDTLKVFWTYPINSNPDVRDTLSHVLGDYVWTCSIRKVTRDIESFETAPLYHYLFDHPVNDSAVWDFVEDWCQDYSCHTGDLFFLFYTLPLEGFAYTEEEKDLAKSMIRYWGNFIHTGNPNTDDWRKNLTSVFKSSQTSSILKHLKKNTKEPSANDILRRLKQGLKADETWPPYAQANGWPSLWFKTPVNDIFYRYKAKYCRVWDDIGY